MGVYRELTHQVQPKWLRFQTGAKECDSNMEATMKLIERRHTEEYTTTEGAKAECPNNSLGIPRVVKQQSLTPHI